MAEDDLSGLGLPPAPMIAAGNARQPLGPPQGFYTDAGIVDPARAAFQPYINGDEWVPAYTMDGADRDRLKARMNAAGLYGSSGYQSGTWTGEDANAYKAVLESANAMFQRDADVVIDNIASEATKGPRVQGPRAPLVSRVSDPETVRQVIRSTALSLTGQRLPPEDEQRIISAYRNYEQNLNQSEYAAGATGGQVNAPMSPQDFAESQIEALRPGEVQADRGMDFMDQILQSINQTTVPMTENYKGAGLPQTGNEVV